MKKIISPNTVPPEISNYLSGIGKKGGKLLFKKRGREYYVNISALAAASRRRNREAREAAKEKETNLS